MSGISGMCIRRPNWAAPLVPLSAITDKRSANHHRANPPLAGQRVLLRHGVYVQVAARHSELITIYVCGRYAGACLPPTPHLLFAIQV